MNLKNKNKIKINNKGAKMKYLILSLMVFGSYQAFSRVTGCNINNYTYFIQNAEETVGLLKTTGKGCYLSRANLSRVNLTGANLPVANLSGTNLRNAKLTGAKLTGAKLNNANLRGVNLTGADLMIAKLNNANLRGANLTGAILTWADLTGANLTGATFPKKHKNMLTKKQQKQVKKFVD